MIATGGYEHTNARVRESAQINPVSAKLEGGCYEILMVGGTNFKKKGDHVKDLAGLPYPNTGETSMKKGKLAVY